MKIWKIYSIIVVGVVMSYGCQTDVLYEHNIPINCNGWNVEDTLVYSVNIQDTTQRYDISVNVRHRDIYEFMNLYVNVITQMPNNQVKQEVISLPLADDGGQWYGSCTGDICFQRVFIMKKATFSIPGVYTFRINQEMRTEELDDIFDMGLRIEKSQKKIYKKDEE